MTSVTPARPIAAAGRVYHLLLYLYPAAYRREYGVPMARLFRDLCRDAHRQRGALGLALLWRRTLVDLFYTAAVEHLDGKGGSLMKTILEREGLVPALVDYGNQLTGTARFQVHLESKDVPRLRAEAERLIFDVVQEAIANTKAHAQADNVWIGIHCQKDTLDVSVRDDGQGFDVDAVTAGRGRPRSGESDMSDRVEMLQGELCVQSTKGKGTTIRFTAPLSPNLA